jgi:hypothetical protein
MNRSPKAHFPSSCPIKLGARGRRGGNVTSVVFKIQKPACIHGIIAFSLSHIKG